MKNPDVVFKELGQLYDFYQEIAKFRLKTKRKPRASSKPGRKSATRPSGKGSATHIAG